MERSIPENTEEGRGWFSGRECQIQSGLLKSRHLLGLVISIRQVISESCSSEGKGWHFKSESAEHLTQKPCKSEPDFDQEVSPSEPNFDQEMSPSEPIFDQEMAPFLMNWSDKQVCERMRSSQATDYA